MRAWAVHSLVCVVASSATAAAGVHGSGQRRVEVFAEPELIVLGGDGPQRATLTIRVVGSKGKPVADADLVLHTTAGSITGIKQLGPGWFEAILNSPSEKFPQLAVVSAADISPTARGEPPWVGQKVVGYSAKIDLKGKTEPRARMKVRIARETFGPVTAGKDGSFVLPVVVPPGENWGFGTSIDNLGNRSRSKINLYLPEVRRVHGFVYPDALLADGSDTGWIFVTTVSKAGAPEDAAIEIVARRGVISKPRRLERGLRRSTFQAPKGVGDGLDRVLVIHQKRRTTTEIPVTLITGAPAKMEARLQPSPIPADGTTAARLSVELFDAHGSRVAGRRVEALLGEETLVAKETEPGFYRIDIAPRATLNRIVAKLQAWPRAEICLRGRLLRTEDDWRVVDHRGVACAGKFKVIGGDRSIKARGELGEGGRISDADAFVAELQSTSRLELEGAKPIRISAAASATTLAPSPLLTEINVAWRLPSAVDVRIREVSRSKGEVWLSVESTGINNLSARIRVEAASGRVEVKPSENVLSVRIIGASLPVDVTAVDEISGVSAWLRVE